MCSFVHSLKLMVTYWLITKFSLTAILNSINYRSFLGSCFFRIFYVRLLIRVKMIHKITNNNDNSIINRLQLDHFSDKCFTIVNKASSNNHLCQLKLICLFSFSIRDSSNEKDYYNRFLISILSSSIKNYWIVWLF